MGKRSHHQYKQGMGGMTANASRNSDATYHLGVARNADAVLTRLVQKALDWVARILGSAYLG